MRKHSFFRRRKRLACRRGNFKKNKINFTPLIFGENEIAKNQSKIFENPILIERKLDSKIFAKNKSGKFFNGHVPFSAILSFVSNLAARLCGAQNLIAANERSANFGNLKFLNLKINHQFSKSFVAEKMISKFLKKNFDIDYFSLLRPFWEIQIAKIFVENCENFFQKFASCNLNFRREKKIKNFWCGNCAKCAFVFGILAAFLPREKLIKIFGQNFFENKKLQIFFDELLGLKNFKPFDCVGEKREFQIALFLAIENFGFSENEIILKNFAAKFLQKKSQKKVLKISAQKFFQNFGAHNLPKKFEKILRKFQK